MPNICKAQGIQLVTMRCFINLSTCHEYGHRNRCAANDCRVVPDEIGRHVEATLIVQICDRGEDRALLTLSTEQFLAA